MKKFIRKSFLLIREKIEKNSSKFFSIFLLLPFSKRDLSVQRNMNDSQPMQRDLELVRYYKDSNLSDKNSTKFIQISESQSSESQSNKLTLTPQQAKEMITFSTNNLKRSNEILEQAIKRQEELDRRQEELDTKAKNSGPFSK